MPIVYSAVAKGTTILCCYQLDQINSTNTSTSFANENYQQPNYSTLVSNILPNISSSTNGNTSYTTNNEIMINVMVDDGLVFLNASSADITKKRSFDFLAEIRSIFKDSHTLVQKAEKASSFELNRDFAAVLSKKMVEYSKEEVPNDAFSRVQAQVDEVKNVMTRNIDAILDRGQRLEDLIDKSNNLEATSSSFQRTTRRVQRKMWWKNTKMTLVCGLVVVIAIIIVILVILFSTGVFPINNDTNKSTTILTTITTANPGPKSNNVVINTPSPVSD